MWKVHTNSLPLKINLSYYSIPLQKKKKNKKLDVLSKVFILLCDICNNSLSIVAIMHSVIKMIVICIAHSH